MLLDDVQSRSAAFAAVLNLAKRVAPTDANVLISGETGTGKDFIAELIHDASARRARPFLKIDCASIPTSLAESEFFGYEKGAFSDAYQSKMGKLELARDGTVYLDGVNHLTHSVQSKLLRFVQERCVERLGSTVAHKIDCRLIASCSVPLHTCLKEKQLREDLYYRLASVFIDLPPLRERLDDIDLLIVAFLREFNEKYKKQAELHPEALDTVKHYHWPGNIRELRNVLEYAVIHSDNADKPVQLLLQQSLGSKDHLAFAADGLLSLDQIEKMYIGEILQRVNGHQGKAAKILKINRKTLMLKKRKYRL
jgi:transcriptional regulator with PAS, ATPase and Fis domain